MTTQTCFRWSLLLPVAVPLLLLPLLLVGGEPAKVAVWATTIPLIFGGLAYAPTAAALAVALGRVTPRMAIVLIWASPLAFAVVEAVFVGLVAAAGPRDGWLLVPVLAGFALVYGYAYVILGTAIYLVLRARGRVVDALPDGAARGQVV
jgi:hypothetical protein